MLKNIFLYKIVVFVNKDLFFQIQLLNLVLRNYNFQIQIVKL